MSKLYDRDELLQTPTILSEWQQTAFSAFVDKMSDKERLFPCIPGQSGFMQNHLRYAFVGDPRDTSTYRDLAVAWAAYTECSRETGKYSSLIVFLETPKDMVDTYSVDDYEKLYWSVVQETSKLDQKEWPAHIPQNPMENTWEYCFHGESYFVYCATPAHVKRQSRHFPVMMLAITPRWVLLDVNDSTVFGRTMKKRIRERIVAYDDAPVHPSLKWYGQEGNYEWQQYFLRDDETAPSKCPFSRLFRSEKTKRSE